MREEPGRESNEQILQVVSKIIDDALTIVIMMEFDFQVQDEDFLSLFNRVNLAHNFIDGHQMIKKSIEKLEEAGFITNNDDSYSPDANKKNMEILKNIYLRMFEYFRRFENCCKKYNKVLMHYIVAGWQCHEIYFKSHNMNTDFNANNKTLEFMLINSSRVENEMKEILTEISPLFNYEPKQDIIGVISKNNIQKNVQKNQKQEGKSYWKKILEFSVEKITGFSRSVASKVTDVGKFAAKNFIELADDDDQDIKKGDENSSKSLTEVLTDAVQPVIKIATKAIKKITKMVDETIEKVNETIIKPVTKKVVSVVKKVGSIVSGVVKIVERGMVYAPMIVAPFSPVAAIVGVVGYGIYHVGKILYNACTRK